MAKTCNSRFIVKKTSFYCKLSWIMFLPSKTFFAWIGIIIIPIKLNRFNLCRIRILEIKFQWTLKSINVYLEIHLHIVVTIEFTCHFIEKFLAQIVLAVHDSVKFSFYEAYVFICSFDQFKISFFVCQPFLKLVCWT